MQHTTDKIVNDGEEKQLENTEFEAETHVRNTDKELGIESEIKSSRFDNRNKVSYTKNNIKTTNVGNKSERKTIENRTKDNSVKTTKNNETYRREPHPKHVNNVRQQNGNKINCNENTSKNESGIADARKETQKRTHEPVRHQLRPTDLEVKNDNDSGRVEPECTIDKPTVRKVLGKLNDDVEYFKKLLNEKGKHLLTCLPL